MTWWLVENVLPHMRPRLDGTRCGAVHEYRTWQCEPVLWDDEEVLAALLMHDQHAVVQLAPRGLEGVHWRTHERIRVA